MLSKRASLYLLHFAYCRQGFASKFHAAASSSPPATLYAHAASALRVRLLRLLPASAERHGALPYLFYRQDFYFTTAEIISLLFHFRVIGR
jgi:hypothetical protein